MSIIKKLKSPVPRFCFVCGSELEEVGLGWLQCESEECGEMFLPYLDEKDNQCLMCQKTPSFKKE